METTTQHGEVDVGLGPGFLRVGEGEWPGKAAERLEMVDRGARPFRPRPEEGAGA